MRGYWYLIFADALLTFISIVLSMMLRLEIIFSEYSLFGFFLKEIWPFIIFAVLLRPLVFHIGGIYRRIWRYASIPDYVAILKAILAGSVILSIVTMFVIYPLWMDTFPRSLLILEGIFSVFLLGGLRLIFRYAERYPGDINWQRVDPFETKRVLIVGAGTAGTQIAQEFRDNPQLNLRPVAILDDDSRKIGRKLLGLHVFGPLVNLPQVIREQQIEEVVIAMPSAPEQTLQNIKNLCTLSHVPYSIMPSWSTILDAPKGVSSKLIVPMAMPHITGEEIQAVVRVMQSRNLSIGAQTTTFERLAAEVAGSTHAVAVTNGTSGLHLCMIAANILPDDEVITTPFSFIASANCILYQNAKPVFVDIDPKTLSIDPQKIESAITKRTKAILPVHVFGQPADMQPILEIAQRHGLLVIEDACEAIGAEYKGKRVGALGDAGVFAFYPNKQVTTGEGAVLLTNSDAFAGMFRSLRNQGRDPFDEWLVHSRLGYNYRLSELNAAVGVVQLKRLDDLLNKREEVVQEYNRRIAGIEAVSPLSIAPETTRMSWFIYPVRFHEGIDRNLVMTQLAEKGIPSRPYFTPIHLQPFYRERFGTSTGMFPVAEKAGNEILALPFYTDMKVEEIEIVCNALAEVIRLVRSQR